MDQEIVNRYKELNWNSLLRKDLGDAGRLDESKPSLDRIKAFLDRFTNSELIDTLPPQAVQEIQNHIKDFLNFCTDTIVAFSDIRQKQEVINKIKDREYNILSILGKYSTYLDAVGLRDNKEEELRLENLKRKEEEIDSLLNTAQEISERSKEVAQGQEARKFGNDFEEQANKHKDSADTNFKWMIGLVVATFVFALILLIGKSTDFNFVENMTNLQTFLKFLSTQNVFLYIIIFSLFSFMISHFSRNYSSEKNLENIYRQKQRVLDSHAQILNSVQSTASEKDLETQNDLLSYMAKALFETRETGYLKGVKHNTNPSNTIIDITKNR